MLSLEQTVAMVLWKAYPFGQPATLDRWDHLINLKIAWEQLRHERSDLARIDGFVLHADAVAVLVANDASGTVEPRPLTDLCLPMPPSTW